MKKNDWKKRDGVVYSTDSNFQFNYGQSEEQETVAPGAQQLRVLLDTSGRAGKQVTLVSGFVGNSADLDSLAKNLKTKCGVGGSVKDGEILIQGDHREKIKQILKNSGYRCK